MKAKIETFETGGVWLWQVRATDRDAEAAISVAANSNRDFPTEAEALSAARRVAKQLGLTIEDYPAAASRPRRM